MEFHVNGGLTPCKHPNFHVKGPVNKGKGVLDLLSTGRKAPPFLERVWDRSLAVIPALPPPLSLALLSPYSFYPYPSVVRPHVCPSWLSWGYLGYILGRLGSLLGHLEAV